MTDSVESFSMMLRTAMGDRIASEAATFLDMLADTAVMEFPYSPPGLPKRLDGKAAITRHLEGLGDMLVFEGMGEPTVHASTDLDVTILEFEGFGRGVSSGEPYDQRYISVIRTEAGRIVHYRDYWNPLVMLRALRGSSAVDTLALGPSVHG